METKTVGRPKKDGQYINCYVKKNIATDLEKFCEDTGLSKTVAVEKAVEKYLEHYKKTGRI